jgi:tRNA(Ile)-lysidine synthase
MMSNMQHPLLNHLQQSLPMQGHYLVACSYGTDSMCLVDGLYRLGYTFSVAHVNYQKRRESHQEMADLITYCQARNIEVYTHVVDQPIIHNFQAEARRIRYAFFAECIHTHHLTALLVAHHQQDQDETQYMQLKRGGFRVQLGIPAVQKLHDIIILRPLLTLSKAIIQDYLLTYQVPHAVDASNAKPIYERNRVRLKMQKWDTKTHLAFEQEVADFHKQYAQAYARVCAYIDHRYVSMQTYERFSVYEQFVWLTHWSEKWATFIPISENVMTHIRQLIQAKKPNTFLRIHPQWLFYKTYTYFTLVPKQGYACIEPVLLNTVETMAFPWGHINVLGNKAMKLRSLQNDDQVQIEGQKRAVRRLMITMKIPVFLRSIYPCLIDEETQAVHIPHYHISKLGEFVCFWPHHK